jgi:hypothetical protein
MTTRNGITYDKSDVLELIAPSFSGGIDEFDKAAASLPPLLLSKISGGLPPDVFSSRLLSLPEDLLSDIVGLLGPGDLSSFAFVNSACRQLARAKQFEHVTFDYLDNGPSTALLKEAIDCPKAALGACVRRLTIATEPVALQLRHDFNLLTLMDLSEAERERKLADAAHEFFNHYMIAVEFIIQSALPNVEVISWLDRGRIHPATARALLESNASMLKFGRVTIDAAVFSYL